LWDSSSGQEARGSGGRNSAIGESDVRATVFRSYAELTGILD